MDRRKLRGSYAAMGQTLDYMDYQRDLEERDRREKEAARQKQLARANEDREKRLNDIEKSRSVDDKLPWDNDSKNVPSSIAAANPAEEAGKKQQSWLSKNTFVDFLEKKKPFYEEMAELNKDKKTLSYIKGTSVQEAKRTLNNTSMYVARPEDYGVSDWWADAKTTFLVNMNQALADEQAGNWNNQQEWIDTAAGAIKEQNNLIKLNAIQKYLDATDNYNKALNHKGEDAERLKYNARYAILDAVQQLKRYYGNNFNPEYNPADYARMYGEAEKIKHDSVYLQNTEAIKKAALGYGATGGFIKQATRWLGFVGTDDVDQSLEDLRDADFSNPEKLTLQLLAFIEHGKNNLRRFKTELKEQERQRDKYANAHKVSDYFNYRIAKSQRDMDNGGGWFNEDNLLYGQVAQQGFSASSWYYQYPAMALSMAGNALMKTGVGSVAGSAAVAAGSLLEYKAGEAEMKAQVIEVAADRIEKALKGRNSESKNYYDKVISEAWADKRITGLSEKEIMQAIAKGDWMPCQSRAYGAIAEGVNAAIAEGRKGSTTYYDEGMTAVVGDAALNFALYGSKGVGNAVKYGWKGGTSATKKILGGTIKKVTDSQKYQVVKNAVTNNAVVKGVTEAGRNVGKYSVRKIKDAEKYVAPFGIGGYGVGAVAETGKDVLKAAGKKALDIKAIRDIAKSKVGVSLALGAENTVAFMKSVPTYILDKTSGKLAKMTGANQFTARLLERRAGAQLGKLAISGYGEELEEGKQYIEGQEWLENAEPEQVISMLDNIANDLTKSVQLMPAALGVPLGLHWGMASNNELFSNMAGGLLGGYIHGGMIQLGSQALQTAWDASGRGTSTKRLDDIILTNAHLDATGSIGMLLSGEQMAKDVAKNNNIGRFLAELNDFREFNKRQKESGNDYVEDSQIDSQEEFIKNIYNQYYSANTEQLAELAGIKKGSKDYYRFVSAKALYSQMRDDSLDNMISSEKQVNDLLSSDIAFMSSVAVDESSADENPILSLFKTDESKDSLEKSPMTRKQRKEAERREKNRKRLIERGGSVDIADEILEGTVGRTTAQESASDSKLQTAQKKDNASAMSNLEVFNRGALVVLELTALTRQLQSIKDVSQASGTYHSNDVNYVIQKIQERIDELKKAIPADKLEHVLQHPEVYTSSVDNADQIMDLYQTRMSNWIDYDTNDMMLRMLTGVRTLEYDENEEDERKRIKQLWGVNNAKDVLDKIQKSIDDDYDLVDRINRDFQLRNYLATTKLQQDIERSAELAELDQMLSSDEKIATEAPEEQPIADNPVEQINIEESEQLRKEAEDAARQELKKEYNEHVAQEEGAAAVVESKDEVKDLKGVKNGDKVVVVDDKSKDYETVTVTKVNHGKVLKAQDESGTAVVAEGNTVPDDQQKRSEELRLKPITAEQKTTFDVLNEKIQKDNSRVVGVSGMHYFIREDDGKVYMYPRVHTVKGDKYEVAPYMDRRLSTSAINANEQKIREFVEKNDIDGLKLFIRSVKGSQLYIDQLLDNKEEVIQALANLVTEYKAGVGVNVGQIVDELVRIFFDDEIEQAFDYDTLEVSIGVDDKKYPISRFISKADFDEFVKDLTKVRENYDKLGYKLSTKRHIWQAQLSVNGKLTRIAGETDIVAVDKEGKLHIIDTKTTKYSFKEGSSYFDQATPKFDGTNALRTTREDYALQLSYYMAMIQKAMSGVQFAENPLELLPVNVEYSRDRMEQIVSDPDTQIAQLPIYSFTNGRNDEPSRIELTPVDSIINGTFDDDNDRREKQEKLGQRSALIVADIVLLEDSIIKHKALLGEHHAGLGEVLKDQESALHKAQDLMKGPHESLKKTLSGAELDAVQSDLDTIAQIVSETNLEVDKIFQENILRKFDPPKPQQPQPQTQPVPDSDGWWKHNTANPYTVNNNIGSDGKTKLSDVTGNPDFGKLSITVVDNLSVNRAGIYIMRCTIIYNGITFKGVEVQAANTAEGRAIFDDVKNMLLNKKEGQRVLLTGMNRTAGKVDIIPAVNITEQPTIMNGKSVYEISTEHTQTTFGLAKRDKSGVLHVYCLGATPGTESMIYTFPKGLGTEGTWYTIIRPDNQNATMPTAPLHLALVNDNINDGDADFIIELLDAISRYGSTDNPYEYYANGETYNLPLTHKELLQLYMPYGDVLTYNKAMHVKVSGNLAVFTSFLPNSDTLIKNEFNLADDQGRLDLKKFLKSQRINIDKKRVDSRLGLAVSGLKSHPFGKIADFFKRHPEIATVKLGRSRITFGKEDFVNPITGDTRGISGLGWMAKNGMLFSNFGGIKNPRFSYTSAILENEERSDNATEQDEVTVLQIIEDESPVDDIASMDLFFNDDTWAKTSRVSGERIDKERAARRLSKMFGGRIPVTIASNLSEILQDKSLPGSVVGLMKNSAIYLQDNAIRGTEYHEAFHVVSRLMLPKSMRKALYKRIRKYMIEEEGEQTVLNAEKSLKNTERLYEEYGADLCMYYFNAVEEIPFSLRNIFDYIRQNIQALRDIGDYRLAALFVAMRMRMFALPVIGRIKNLELSAFTSTHTFSSRGHVFEHVVNQSMYDGLQKSLLYYILRFLNIKRTGENLSDLDLSEKMLDRVIPKRDSVTGKVAKDSKGNVVYIGTVRDAIIKSCQTYNKETKKHEDNAVSLAVKEIFDNWSVLKQDFSHYIEENFGIEYYEKIEQEADERALDGDDNEPGEERMHGKASYEESRTTKATTGVKFFTSLIKANGTVVKTGKKDKNGEDIYTVQYGKNEFGLYEFMDSKEVLNRMLNDLHSVKSPSQMISKMEEFGKTDAMYFQLAKFLKYLNSTKTRKNGSVNHNAQLFVTQVFNLMASAKNNFVRVTAKRDNATGKYVMTVENCGQSYEASQYRRDWGRLLVYGGTSLFKHTDSGDLVPEVFSNGQTGIDILGSLIFDKISEIKKEFSTENLLRLNDHGKPNLMFRNLKTGKFEPCNVTTEEGAQLVVERLCSMFNYMGIQFDVPEFKYMLQQKYLDKGFKTLSSQLEQFFNQTGEDNIEQLWGSDYKFIVKNDEGKWVPNWTADGKIFKGKDSIPVENLYNNNSFLISLSNWKYLYQHSFTDLSALVSNNKTYYEISENSLITDVVDELNEGGSLIDNLMKFNYNFISYDENGLQKLIGSLIVKQILTSRTTGEPVDIKISTLTQFLTNESGDQGAGYFDISEREDYVAKATILKEGGLLFPTMSDKKTWVYITGINIPGLEYTTDKNSNPIIAKDPKAATDEILDQLVEYADTERACVVQTLDLLKYLDESEKVSNFHKGAKIKAKDGTHTIPNGAVFGSLTGVYLTNPSTNKVEFYSFTKFLDKNGKFISPEENLKRADLLFFSRSPEQKREILRYALEVQVDKELAYLEKLGLIVKNQYGYYENRGLDDQALSAIARKKTPAATTINEYQKNAAIRDYVRDIVAKHMISIHEVERVFSGHPGFFKYKFDEKTGQLINRHEDEFKRFGGLISTGVNNNMDIEGLPEDGQYTCSVVNNEMVQSPLLDYIKRVIELAEWRKALRSIMIPNTARKEFALETNDFINSLNVQQIKEKINTEYKDKASIIPVVEKKVDKIVNAYKIDNDEDLLGIDVADGGAYISPQMTKWLLLMCGEYSNRVDRAFEILENPDKYDVATQQDAYALVTTKVIGAQKYTAYGMRLSSDQKTMIPYYNKMALFPVFKCIATGKFAKIYDQMVNNKDEQGNDNPIHMLMVKSAVKLGDQGSVDYTPGCKLNTFKQPFDRLRKQFNTNLHSHEDLQMGTQTVKVALSSLILNKNYIVNGQPVSGLQVLDRIMLNINQLAMLGKDEFEQLIFTDGEVDPKKFSDFLKDQLTSKDADKSIIESIEAVPVKDQNENTIGWRLRHPLAAISRMSWLQSILASVLNKRIVEVRTPGAAFYQRSIWGMEGKSADFIDDENLPEDINGGEDLKMIVEEGPAKGAMQCVLSIDYFHDILKEAGLENASFAEQKKALIEAGVIGKNAKPNLIGYRIPTQAQSSIHALVCVDVLPVIHSTIILPKEFTKITGSDFDIDKIFIASKNIKMVQTDGQWTQSKIEDNKLSLQNDLIDLYTSVLLDPEGMNAANRPIDNDTQLIKDVLKDLESDSTKKTLYVDPFDFYSLRTHASAKNNFLTGKTGIGPFALNNNSHILTMLYNVKFSYDSVMGKLGTSSLGKDVDMDGESILSWISALINAHVDIAKDPYISRLNVNQMTYNLVNLLIRTGYGKRTFYFTKQPAMLKMAEKYALAQGRFMQDTTRSSYIVRQEAKKDAILELVGEDIYLDICLKFEVDVDHPYGKVIQFAGGLLRDGSVLREIAKNPNALNESKKYTIATTKDGREIQYTAKEIQVIVYLLDMALEKPALALSDLVKYSKIDTKKQGKNVSEQIAYLRGVARVFDDSSIIEDLFGDTETENIDVYEDSYSTGEFDFLGINRMYRESFIRTKTKLAIYEFMKTLRGQALEATPAFLNVVQRLCTYFHRNDDSAIVTISNALAAHLKSEAIYDYARRMDIDVKGLVSGRNTIYDRLNVIKNKINRDPSYSDVKNNTLLQLLIADKTWTYNPYAHPGHAVDRFENLKFLRLFDALDKSSAKTDYIISAWDALLKDGSHPDLQEFARDLCVYAFVTSGDQQGRTKLFSYVPNSFREESGYVEHISKTLQMLNVDDEEATNVGRKLFTDELIDDIALNHWKDNVFVRSIKLEDKKWTKESGQPKWKPIYMNRETGGENSYKPSYPIFITADEQYPVKFDDCPMFISVAHTKRYADDDSSRATSVYKMAGFIPVRREGDTVTRGIPCYVKVNTKSYHISSSYDYYEFGQESKDKEYFPSVRLMKKTFAQILNNIEAYKSVYGNDFDLAARALQEQPLAVGMKQTSEWDGYLEIELEQDGRTYPIPTRSTDADIIDINTISKNTVAFGVELNGGGAKMMQSDARSWQQNNPDGIVAYRKYKDSQETFSRKAVQEGWIGNPFSVESKGKDTVQKFYEWIVYGTDFEELRANEDFRQAIREKILNTPEGSPVLYYTELGRPSHATVIGYLIQNKQLLQQNKPEGHIAQPVTSIPAYYEGMITPEENTIFVFGSNPEGRHGTGAAKVARDQFGAIYGQGEGLQGNSYALPTKDLRSKPLYSEDGGKTPVTMYRGYALTEDREAYNIEETVGKTAVDYDDSLKGSLYFTSSKEEAYDYAKTRTDKSPEPPTQENPQGRPVNRHYTGDYAKVSRYFITPDAKVEHFKDITDYIKNGRNSDADVIVLDKGTAFSDNTEYIVKNPNVIVYDKMLRSVSPAQITENIRKMYDVARQNPTKLFKVAYTNGLNRATLNGYTGAEMIKMFKDAGPIPSNVVFSKNWVDHWNEVQPVDQVLQLEPSVLQLIIDHLKSILSPLGLSVKGRAAMDQYLKDHPNTTLQLAVVYTKNDDIQYFATPQGEIYGFVDKEGNVYLDETIISPEHPIHEYTHLWDRIIAKNNPKLWKRGVELMKQTSLWKEIKEDPNYGQRWKAIKGISDEKVESLIASEVHARFSGEGGSQLIEKLAKEKSQKGIINKIKDWILEVWKDLRQTFAPWSDAELDSLTLKDFNHMPVRDFVSGISLAKAMSEQKKVGIGTKENPIQIYSDGSDIKGTGQIGYGAVFMHEGKAYGLSGTEASAEVANLKEKFPDAKFSNPTMEMLALTTTLEHFANSGIGEHIEINQDYKGAVNFGELWKYSEGSEQREAKAWKPKEAYIAHLVDRTSAAINQIEKNGGSVKIKWVKGHQKVGTELAKMNDLADSYAKSRDEYNNISSAYNAMQEQMYISPRFERRFGYSVENIYTYLSNLTNYIGKGSLTVKKLGEHIAKVNKQFGTSFSGPYWSKEDNKWKIAFNRTPVSQLGLEDRDVIQELKELGEQLMKACKI